MNETYSSSELTPTKEDIERIQAHVSEQFSKHLAEAIEKESDRILQELAEAEAKYRDA